MKIFYLEYRSIYSSVVNREVFASASSREAFIVHDESIKNAAYLLEVNFDINSQPALIEMIKQIICERCL